MKNPKNNISYLAAGMGLIILIMIAMSITRHFEAKHINHQMKSTLSQQMKYADIHTSIYRNLVDRTTIMHKLSRTDDPVLQEKLKQNLKVKIVELKGYQAMCVHPHLTQKPNFFTNQGQEIGEFNKLQSRFVSMSEMYSKEHVHDFFIENIIPKRSSTLAIIQEGINQISTTANGLTQHLTKENQKQIFQTFIINIIVTLLCFGLFLFLLLKQFSFTKKLDIKAKTDELTKLANRTQFIQEANEYLVENPDSPFVVSFLDIDYFKNINDSYGHEIGDQLIKSFAEKIQSIVNETCILARFGGDEFVLLIKNVDNDETLRIIKKLSSVLNTLLYIEKNEINISASIGVARYPNDGDSITKLLKCADDAMYSAKRAGRNTYQFYSREMRDLDIKNDNIIQELRSILSHENSCGSLYLEYQPLLNCVDDSKNDINECEALIRWKGSDGKFTPTGEFIPLAEKSNLIETVNCFVIDEVCRQQKIWQEEGNVKKLRVNINLSGEKESFIRQLAKLRTNIEDLNLDSRLFGIELTERTLFDINENTIYELNLIREMGIKVSIDDFGTGYSSLSYLNKLPLTTLKIDKTFVDDLPDNLYSRTIVTSTIALAHSLGIEVVAEGVETKQQHDYLLTQSCNYIQGYFYKKPMSDTAISSLFRLSK